MKNLLSITSRFQKYEYPNSAHLSYSILGIFARLTSTSGKKYKYSHSMIYEKNPIYGAWTEGIITKNEQIGKTFFKTTKVQ